MAKMVGQFAVAHGQTTATKKLTKVQEQAEAILAEFGIGRASGREPVADAPRPMRRRLSPRLRHPAESSAAAADLPIADYDSLAASQVIPRLAGLSEVELAGRARLRARATAAARRSWARSPNSAE